MSLSLSALRVLRAMLENNLGRHYGQALIRSSGVKAGVIYPLLARLEEQHYITGMWEPLVEVRGHKRRRYYWLTADGERHTCAALQELVQTLTPPQTLQVRGLDDD